MRNCIPSTSHQQPKLPATKVGLEWVLWPSSHARQPHSCTRRQADMAHWTETEKMVCAGTGLMAGQQGQDLRERWKVSSETLHKTKSVDFQLAWTTVFCLLSNKNK